MRKMKARFMEVSFNNLRCNLPVKFVATLSRDKLKENNKQLEKSWTLNA